MSTSGARAVVAGRYSLLREIGRGGMGSVWLAEDEVLGREVALKRIATPPGAEVDLARVEREARLAARLSHPHVVAVYDLLDDGEHRWLVMEHVAGRNLADLVRETGGISPDAAARLLSQAADALAAAHAAGVVHRDVKPSNILVTPSGQVKLTDFGIARAAADSTLTQTGMVTGSPAYLAPEVAAGGQATEASDVWSLGATLYHALAGRPPYDVSGNVLGALYRIIHEEPPRLPDAGWLAPVLERTMATDPSDRWPMSRVRDVLARSTPVEVAPPPGRTRRSEPPERTRVIAPPPSQPEAAPRAGRRRPRTWVLAVGAVAVLAVVAALLAGILAGDDPSRQAGEVADEPTVSASGPESSPSSPTATPGPTAAGMEQFVRDYLATVTSDPADAWERLTPAFQRASGGFDSYRGFWATIEAARVRDVRADPETLTVSYDVTYRRSDGSRFDDEVSLVLVHRDGRYLIDREP